ncbi:MAG: hypothetical protein ACFCGT_02915 [Sandaracinaceae bacterium]
MTLLLAGTWAGSAHAQPPAEDAAPAEEAAPAEAPPAEETAPPEETGEEAAPPEETAPSAEEAAAASAGVVGALPAEEEEQSVLLGDEQADLEYTTPEEEVRSSTDPFEAQDESYFFLGAFGRWVGMPRFLQNVFIDGGVDANNPGVGLDFTWRKNQFSVGAQVWWMNGQGTGFYRLTNDPIDETEFIDADLGVIFVNATFLWAFPFTDWFAFELGFDVGLGFVYGDLMRTEAYPTNYPADQTGPPYSVCNGPGDPESGQFCEPDVAPTPCHQNLGGHYGPCNEPSWINGGDRPLIWPWISLPHLALRFKPVRQLMIRIDGGYAIWGFFAGGSASYGF